MSEETPHSTQSKALFANLVAMFSTSALQQMGKLVNPLTNKTEVNLPGAQLAIDTLNMLKEKTQGHLDDEEEAMLTDSLSGLQMNYVETAGSAQDRPAPEPRENPHQPAADDGDSPGESPEEQPGVKASGDGKEPRYHKSYGA
jgi:hypothetical protein